MKIVAVVSRKGGAGKTTVAVNLAVAAQHAGIKVVLADVDPLHSAAVILGRRADAASLLIETKAAKLRAVRDACRHARCDLLIVDTPPGPEGDVLKVLEIADLCVAVARPTALDVAAVCETLGLISRRGRDGLIVLNQCPPLRAGMEAPLTRAAIQALEFYGLPLAATRLRSRVAYQHASGERLGVTEWDQNSDAALDILRLMEELGERLFYRPAQARSAPTVADERMPWTPQSALPGSEACFMLGLQSLSVAECWSAFGV